VQLLRVFIKHNKWFYRFSLTAFSLNLFISIASLSIKSIDFVYQFSFTLRQPNRSNNKLWCTLLKSKEHIAFEGTFSKFVLFSFFCLIDGKSRERRKEKQGRTRLYGDQVLLKWESKNLFSFLFYLLLLSCFGSERYWTRDKKESNIGFLIKGFSLSFLSSRWLLQ
jgi:hypothetical protein